MGMKTLLLSFLLATSLMADAFLGRQAEAHPHVFISQRTAFVFDGEGLAGFRIHWTFDDMFSIMIQEDFDADRDGHLNDEEIGVIREKAFAYTAEHSYFIHVKIDGKPFAVAAVTDFNAWLDDGKVSYEFFIPCPVSAVADPREIILSPYDEGYYSAMYFPDDQPVVLENSDAFHTRLSLKQDMGTRIYYDTVNPMAIFLILGLTP